jgi:hypothetical protein
MLKITIPAIELYDDAKNEFVSIREQTLSLEHSLVSLSKWESKWNKPFLTKETKTIEETIDYIKCMTITQNINDMIYNYIPSYIIDKVTRYIEAEMTATKISNQGKSINREITTAEIIYYWMIALNIPFDPCQKWHLDRLLTLINVCNIKNSPPKKMSRKELASRNSALNAARKKQLNSKG